MAVRFFRAPFRLFLAGGILLLYFGLTAASAQSPVHAAASPSPASSADTPYGRYHRLCAVIILRNWRMRLLAYPVDVAKVRVTFTITSSGAVSNITVLHHGGDPAAVYDALAAIRNSVLPPIPSEFSHKKIKMTVLFNDYDPAPHSPATSPSKV